MWEHAAIVAPESAAYRIVHGVWIGCAIAADILWGSGCLALVCDYVSRAIFSFRSCPSWASKVIVAIERASSRLSEIGSPVIWQYHRRHHRSCAAPHRFLR